MGRRYLLRILRQVDEFLKDGDAEASLLQVIEKRRQIRIKVVVSDLSDAVIVQPK